MNIYREGSFIGCCLSGLITLAFALALALALALAPLAREIASSYYVRKRQMEEVMHMCGCVPNLETPIERTKKLRYRVIKYVFTRVRAAYCGHLVTDYRGLHAG